MPAKSKIIGRKIGHTFMWLIFIVNLFFLTLLVISRLSFTIPPEKSTFFSYLGIGFSILFIINILFFLFWTILLKWKFVIFDLLIFIVCWGTISTYFPFNFKTHNIPDDCIKILSYNVRGFNWKQGKEAEKNPIFDYLNNSGADIICLQEFVASNQKRNPREVITEKQIKKKLSNYPYYSVTRFGHKSQYSFGVACYSKFPIKKATHIPSYSTYNGSVLYELIINDKKVSIINNHLETNGITAKDKQLYKDFMENKDQHMINDVASNIIARLDNAYIRRAAQADTIANWIERQKEKADALIVCGDFNDTPISYTYAKIKGDMIDSYKETGLGTGITYHENKFWFRIDYIMHSQNLESYNCSVGNVKYSDHYPIWTYLRFK